MMALFSNLRTASSGLAVSSTAMSVIGDNIANVNTIGFKRGRASFSDSFPVDVSYVHGPISIGTGAFVGKSANEFSQGALQISNNNLHMALSGNGFFTMRDGSQNFYTRNGEFFLDKDGFMVNNNGLRLQGYQALDGEIQPDIGDIQVDLGHISSEATSSITLQANLNSDVQSSTDLASLTLDGSTTAATISEVVDSAAFSTSVSVYDSLGARHDLTYAFEKNSTNNWTCYIVADGGEIEDSANASGTKTSGSAFEIATIDLTFDTNGSITSMSSSFTSSTTPWSYVGAETFSSGDEYAFNFGQDDDGDGIPDNNGMLSQLASDSTITSLNQEGYSVGHLTSIMVETDGTLVGRYDNGQDIEVGQVAVASFDSVNGLERMGGNLFRASRLPGEPTFGTAGVGGRGDIFGSSLEASNVDIEDEFVNMITAQRSYQANSRVMSSTNELLRELVNLV